MTNDVNPTWERIKSLQEQGQAINHRDRAIKDLLTNMVDVAPGARLESARVIADLLLLDYPKHAANRDHIVDFFFETSNVLTRFGDVGHVKDMLDGEIGLLDSYARQLRGEEERSGSEKERPPDKTDDPEKQIW